MLKTIHNNFFYIGLLSLAVLVLAFFILPSYLPVDFFDSRNNLASLITSIASTTPEEPVLPEVKAVAHLDTPEAVKGIYMTACVAGTPSFRAKLLKLAQETEINSIVIDVKDYTGTISFEIANPEFKDNAGTGCKVADMADFVKTLHDNGIYVIARITAFQDPYMAKINPDWAVKKNSDKTVNWKDGKGISYIDAGNKEMWKYLVDLGKESYAIGFDEINYDYIRFPSDGNMKDIYYPWSNDTLTANARNTVSGKSIVIREFFEYLYENFEPAGIPISADLFGMTTTNTDDLNIGQVLEDAAPNFDYICPMVYPSHYPVGYLGYKTVAEVNAHPYEIVEYSMAIAVKRLKALVEPTTITIASTTASTTDTIVIPAKYDKVAELRPWLQDNDYPVPYTPEMVRAQIQATYDTGLDSWMLWDAGNTYTQAALKAE